MWRMSLIQIKGKLSLKLRKQECKVSKVIFTDEKKTKTL